jgi:hypothetical protein
MSSRYLPAVAGLAVIAILATGCGDSGGPVVSPDALTVDQAQSLGDEAAADAGDLSDDFGFDANTGILMSFSAAQPHLVAPPNCVTFSPDPPANTDGDAVPDSVRFDYSNCGFTRAGGNIIDSLSGFIDFLDPLPADSSIGVRHVFTNFTFKRLNIPFPRRSYVAVRNGTREWGGSPDTLGHTITQFSTTWTHLVSGRTTSHLRNWVGKFTADVPGSIQAGTDLPAGTWTGNGTGTWTTESRSWTVQTTTPTPLHFNPTCDVEPRLDAGVLSLVVIRNSGQTTVTVQFTACGQYTVTRTVSG